MRTTNPQLTENGFFNVELDEIFEKAGPESNIMDKIQEKISEMRRDGFYLDIKCKQGIDVTALILDVWREVFDVCGLDCPDPADMYQVERTYRGIDDVIHQFVHVNPDMFKFNYVDRNHLEPMYDPETPTPLIDSFWGIYIESPKLMVHDLIQYDVFRDIWWNIPFNIYDGGRMILPTSRMILPIRKIELLPYRCYTFSLYGFPLSLYGFPPGISHKSGAAFPSNAVFSSIRDMAETNMRLNDFRLKCAEDKVAEFRRQLSKGEDELWKIRADATRERCFLESTILTNKSQKPIDEVVG